MVFKNAYIDTKLYLVSWTGIVQVKLNFVCFFLDGKRTLLRATFIYKRYLPHFVRNYQALGTVQELGKEARHGAEMYLQWHIIL